MEFNHDLKSFDNIFLGFDNKNKLKNYTKLNKNNIKFFINLKIYTKWKEKKMKTINFYKKEKLIFSVYA